GNVAALLIEESLDSPGHLTIRELANRIRSVVRQMPEVIDGLLQSVTVSSWRMDRNCSGKFLVDSSCIIFIARTAIVGKQRYRMLLGKMSQQVIGTDLSSAVHRKQFAGFNPYDLHQQIPSYGPGLPTRRFFSRFARSMIVCSGRSFASNAALSMP